MGRFAQLFRAERIEVRVAVVGRHVDGHTVVLGHGGLVVHCHRWLIGAARRGDHHVVDHHVAAQGAETDQVEVGLGQGATGQTGQVDADGQDLAIIEFAVGAQSQYLHPGCGVYRAIGLDIQCRVVHGQTGGADQRQHGVAQQRELEGVERSAVGAVEMRAVQREAQGLRICRQGEGLRRLGHHVGVFVQRQDAATDQAAAAQRPAEIGVDRVGYVEVAVEDADVRRWSIEQCRPGCTKHAERRLATWLSAVVDYFGTNRLL